MEEDYKSKEIIESSEEGGSDGRPYWCPEEDGDGDTCSKCPNLSSRDVGHPGGSSYHTVKKYSCMLGYWEDNF